MSYVYAVQDGLVLNNAGGGTVMLSRGSVWFADDPFVISRRDLFSSTPVVVHSTVGRTELDPAPAEEAPRRGRARA